MESLTPNNTKQHQNTPSEEQITPVQMRAVTLKAEGKKYGEISATIDVPEETIKNWFRGGTKVSKHYFEYCHNMLYQMGLETEREIERMAQEATETLKELMSEEAPPAIRLKVCDYVIQRNLERTGVERTKRALERESVAKFREMEKDGFILPEYQKDEMAEKEKNLKNTWD